MRLHLGCGQVYLKDWVNIDIQGVLGTSYPDLLGMNETVLENYYKQFITKDQFMSSNFRRREIVCDMVADIRELNLVYPPNSVEIILAVQVFEHFTFNEGYQVLQSWHSLLEKGGYVQLHVPDIAGIVDEYKKDPKWAIRQIYGSQKDEYSQHKAGYTKESLAKLLKDVGFSKVKYISSINDYPAIGIKGFK